PSLVFGPGDRGNLLSLIRNIKEGKYKHIGGAETSKSVIHSTDLAKAINLCLNNLPDGVQVFNVANPDPVSVKLLTESIAKCLNMSGKIASVPEGVFRIGAKVAQIFMQEKSPITIDQVNKLTTNTTISTARLVGATGFAPDMALEKAIEEEIQWASAANLL
ncbi:MAG TPA: hypothetical protein V6C72_17640, partial [Chroococcales cyanobacterium]